MKVKTNLKISQVVPLGLEPSPRPSLAGRIEEEGPVAEVLGNPLHPYTKGLLASDVDRVPAGDLIAAIAEAPCDLRALPPGCSFAPRCHFSVDACVMAVPDIWRRDARHMARCVRAEAFARLPHEEGVYDA